MFKALSSAIAIVVATHRKNVLHNSRHVTDIVRFLNVILNKLIIFSPAKSYN
jgi:hypothetical protein